MRDIEEYALIGDCETAALVSREGSIDWLCFPRFDSPACFAALLGEVDNGRWLISPSSPIEATNRRYRGDTLVLETEHQTEEGLVSVIDFMPIRTDLPDLVRIVTGKSGTVRMRMELIIRFDYGHVVPWVRRADGGIDAIAGPDMLWLRSDVPTHGKEFRTLAEFTVSEGQRIGFDLTWYPSHRPHPGRIDVEKSLIETERWWQDWSDRSEYVGPWKEAVTRSLITLKALTYAPTGGLVAAPTTSLPEKLGGTRNWDYRYCWLRDATFTLIALMDAGYSDEARAWREWLLRAVAGKPDQIQIMYGLAGERRLTELELPWLRGFAGSTPVRIGNAAYGQLQLDVFGEILDAMYQASRLGLLPDRNAWQVQCSLLKHLESLWREPDEGVWEVRGPRRHFTHSKIMAWLAFDRGVKSIEQFKLDGPLERWRKQRDQIHAEVLENGFNHRRKAFVQYYGSDELDASLLVAPLVGFLPATDPRMISTIDAIERELSQDGFVSRYHTNPEVDGLPPDEGKFLLCSFWLVDALELIGRHEHARGVFEKLLSVRNDVGLLAEGFDPAGKRFTGNFPQAFSHVGLVNSAMNLSHQKRPVLQRTES